MYKIYLDNFRGFQNQFIDIKKNNFLVGENSTGKSSLIYAISFLANFNPFLELDFQNEDYNISSFNDIVSVNSEDKSYFQIGIIFDKVSNNSFILKMTNNNGIPELKSAIISIDELCFLCKSNEKSVLCEEVNKEFLQNPQKADQYVYKDKCVNFDQSAFNPYKLFQFIYAIHNKYKKKLKHSNSFFDIGLRGMTSRYKFIAPIRSKPNKTFDGSFEHVTPEGGDVYFKIRELEKGEDKSLRDKIDLKTILKQYGKSSGLFKKLSTVEFTTRSKYSMDSPFQVNVTLDKKPVNIVHVGYGVSQVLPILFESISQHDTTIVIQQPEVHLHPKSQAALGELFYEVSITNNNRYIIETHSDFIINRYRQMIRKKKMANDTHIIFFHRDFGINTAVSISIDENGEYDVNQPKEFQEFFLQEELKNLGY